MVLTEADPTPLVYERVKRSAQTTVVGGFYKLSFQAMSTPSRVHFRTVDAALARAFQAEVLRWVSWFEARYSRFIPESLIGRINAAAGIDWVETDAESDSLFNLCQDMIFFTRGVFDPTSLPLIRLWNWKANPPVVPTADQVRETMELVGWRKVQRRPGAIFLPRKGMSLDLGGIGKEYAVDRVTTMALQAGIEHVLVDFGQDVRVHGEPPERGAWHVGLDDPKNPGRPWTGVAVTNHAVATSGDYFRHFTHQGRRYGHILDPRDGYPVNNNCLAVSIIAPTCTMAGILSTSAYILGAHDGMHLMRVCPGVEGSIITESNRFVSKQFYAYSTSKF